MSTPSVSLKSPYTATPRAGLYGTKKLHKIMKGLGYATVEGCPGFFYHKQLDVEVTVYVDDLILIAPPNLKNKFGLSLKNI